jgi:hypothetical protein
VEVDFPGPLTSVPPAHVQTLQDYWLWLDEQIGGSGGYLDEESWLAVELPIDVLGNPSAVRVRKQRLRFHDETFLDIRLVVNSSLEPEDYSFHFQRAAGELIWRKDKHPGHEAVIGQLEHIHDDPLDPNRVRPFREVELDEAISQVWEYQQGNSRVGSGRDA